jgi:thioesterase domain-containing protein
VVGGPADQLLTSPGPVLGWRVALAAGVDLAALRQAWAEPGSGPAGRLSVVRWEDVDEPVFATVAAAMLAGSAGRASAVLSGPDAAELVLGGGAPAPEMVARLSAGYAALRPGADLVAPGARPRPVPPAASPAHVDVPPASPPASADITLAAAGRPWLHLLCPGGGGAVSAYQDLAARLPGSWTTTATDDDGRLDSVADLAAAHLDRPRDVDLIGGWSMAGLVGYEVVRRLVAAGAPRLPALLLVDSPPPIGVRAGYPPQLPLLEFAESLWQGFGLRRHALAELDTEPTTAARVLAATLHCLGEEVPASWLAGRIDTYLRHRRAVAECRVAEPVPVPTLLVVGGLPEEHVREWRRRLPGPLTVARLPGDHFDLMRPPLVDELARLLVRFAGAR